MTKLIGFIMMLFLSMSSSAYALDDCTSIVTSAEEAAKKADSIIEANIATIVRIDQAPKHFMLFIDDAKVIHELKKSPRFSTATLRVDSCFPNGTKELWGVAAKQINGKRMRFFGTHLQAGGVRKVFFMQPAGQPMPALPAAREQYVTSRHRNVVAKGGPDGWARVRSTQGPFSIEMPVPADDITRMEDGEPGFMLRATDRNGIVFMAVFERAGPASGMGGTFDTMALEPGSRFTMFKGAEAISTSGELNHAEGKMVSHGLWFRVPGGTYMLSVMATKQREAEAIKLRDRFFNSLVFE